MGQEMGNRMFKRTGNVPVGFLYLVLVGGGGDAECVVKFGFGYHGVRVGTFGSLELCKRVDASSRRGECQKMYGVQNERLV